MGASPDGVWGLAAAAPCAHGPDVHQGVAADHVIALIEVHRGVTVGHGQGHQVAGLQRLADARRDHRPVLIAHEGEDTGATAEDARKMTEAMATELGLPDEVVQPDDTEMDVVEAAPETPNNPGVPLWEATTFAYVVTSFASWTHSIHTYIFWDMMCSVYACCRKGFACMYPFLYLVYKKI